MRTFAKSDKLHGVCYDVRGPVLDAANEMKRQGTEILQLNIGNPAPFGFQAPSWILDAIRDALDDPMSQGYSESNGIVEAREAILDYHRSKGLPNLEMNHIYIGNGVSEMISLAMQGLLNDGDEILIPAPDYPLWTAAAKLAGGTPVHYICDEKSNWYPDIADMEKKINSRTKGIVIINPNNPTGALYPKEVLEQIVTKIPAPTGDENAPLQALIFDSLYDSYKGVIIFCRIKEGKVKRGTKIRMMATGAVEEVVEVGYFGAGQFIPCEELSAGMVGYITASIKNVKDTRVGDTVTDNDNPCAEPLPGYKKVNPMVYCGLYPADGAKYQDLREALEKLQLNDASLQFEPETSIALGFGFRCGFLGLLHLEIIQERLEREYNLDLVTTAPGVIYKVHKTNGEVIDLTNPSNMPDPSEIEYMEEPMVSAEIMVTTEFVGPIMKLCQERRGIYNGMEYIEQTRALLKYDLPLNEIIYDFFDALKSRSRGYASFDYEMKGYERSSLVKLDILINKEEVDALSFIVFSGNAEERGRKMCEKLKQEIPRQLFEIPIQAAIGSRVIARETVKAMRKDVLAKCYGGDISRKKKLLEKQKEGKKRMRQVGNVEIPQKAFMSVLKLDEE